MTHTVDRPPRPSVEAGQIEAIEQRRRVWPINVSTGLLLIRLVVGLLFVGHGCQKLFGWFGGEGMEAWVGTIEKAGLHPASLWASLEAWAELGTGLGLAVGLLTPFAAALLVGDMLVAIVKVHAPKGLWSQYGGFEYNLVLIALLVAFGLMGPGLYSLDRRLPFALPRPHTFIVALAITLVITGLAIAPSMGAPLDGR
jgi:putative oxidoreductase